MKEGVDVIYVSCWLKDAEDYVDVIFVFFVPHGFLYILHKFFARFLRRERRTKKKCVHSMICAIHEWLQEPGICETCGKLLHRIHQQDQDRPGTLNNQFFNGCFKRMTPNCCIKKRLFHQTSILNWLFGVPGVGLCTPFQLLS